jgi:hypothetical protein
VVQEHLDGGGYFGRTGLHYPEQVEQAVPSFPECIAVRAVRRLVRERLFGDNLAEGRESIRLVVADCLAEAQFGQRLQGVPEVSPKLFRQFVVARRRGGRLAAALDLRGHRRISTASSIYSVALQTVSRRWRRARPNLKAA